jgi:hypothetical protein
MALVTIFFLSHRLSSVVTGLAIRTHADFTSQISLVPIWGWVDPRALFRSEKIPHRLGFELQTSLLAGECTNHYDTELIYWLDVHTNYSLSQQSNIIVTSEPQQYTSTIVTAPVRDYMGLAVFACLCCFWPLGLVAISKANEVRMTTSFNIDH